MIIFDKGKPLSKEFCDFCKKEIKPGERMIISAVCPSHERQLTNRLSPAFFYSTLDNAPRYHEKCFVKHYEKSNK